MTTAPTELKPCPFCRGALRINEVQKPDGNSGWVTCGYRASCASCHALMSEAPTEAEAIAAWNIRAPAVGAVRVKPLWMADMLSRNAGNTEGAPAWIRVAQDGEGMHGGFWTCAAATENSPQYIRADLVRKALEPQAVDDAMVERMARAHDKEEAAQRGEPSPWDDPTIDAAWIAERITCMRAALQAAKEPSQHQPKTWGAWERAQQENERK